MQVTFFYVACCAAPIAFAPAMVLAQADTVRSDSVALLDPVVVTAERTPRLASAQPGAVRVLTREVLARRAAPDLAVALRNVPGVQLDPVPGSGTGVVLQGLGSDRVAVLIDGAPLTGRLGGELDLTRLDPSLFERVEIVEGPQSTLYGSSALGGVINLLTRAHDGSRAELITQAGTFGQRDARLRFSEQLGPRSAASLELARRTIDLAPGKAADVPGLAHRWDGMTRVASSFGHTQLDLRLLGGIDEQQYPSGNTWNFNDNWHADALARVTLGSRGATEVRAHVSWYDHRLLRSPTGTAREGTPE